MNGVGNSPVSELSDWVCRVDDQSEQRIEAKTCYAGRNEMCHRRLGYIDTLGAWYSRRPRTVT
jgi:hypothetical protein